MPRYQVVIQAKRPERSAGTGMNPWKAEWGRGHVYSLAIGPDVAQVANCRAADARLARDTVLARFTALARAHLATDVSIEDVHVRRLRRGRPSVAVDVPSRPDDGDDGTVGAFVPRTPLPPTGHLKAAKLPPTS
ncbi:hypothetical protein GTQ99_11680 [Kineococcus sp. T13]|uniref:hypothetical protein n=1 Tax=Kineococcus vitellinus TaxID=2696565 RepID=UPI001412CA43|nr:hypothetical protein [Kineococcus vitellinus]NAZ76066.1 hypothetical protein [Kineococcus vitellinus]